MENHARDVTSEQFLLHHDKAREIYTAIISDPIIDYHTHIDPKAMAENLKFDNITQVLLGSTKVGSPVFDHYLARLLIAKGLSTELVYGTGELDDKERFMEIAKIFPDLAPSPTYQWIVMTLREFFAVDEVLSLANAETIWQKCNELLANDDRFTIRGLLEQRNIQVCCTTDDPTYTLEHHDRYNQDSSVRTKLFPTWRPDKALIIVDDRRNQFATWLAELGKAVNKDISDLSGFLHALRERHDFFHEKDCRSADIGLRNFVSVDYTREDVEAIFKKRLEQGSESITKEEEAKYQSFMLRELARMNAEKDWVQQFHQGPVRDANGQLFDGYGADVGGDYIGEPTDILALQRFLDELDQEKLLAKTIIYPLNSQSYKPVLSLIGAFQKDGTRIHLGVPWWFNDTEDGNRDFIKLIAEQAVLSEHIGMLSDSRSPLSAGIRFDYFRRILADQLAQLMPEKNTEELIDFAHKVTYRNVTEYFGYSNFINA